VGALVATYWDDSWHTDKGRDEFAIPPHLLLYGGVLVASLAVAAWGVLAWRSAGWGAGGLRRVLGDPALQLAGMGGVVTLLSGPVDDAWHTAYGRDAVLWSPPHLAAVTGTLALSVGLLAGLRDARGRGASTARLFASAGVIGALQVPVLEYDSDVPQFSTLWFLPVAALGLCVAAALLDDLLPERWAPVKAAAIYTALRAGTVMLLAVLGFSLTTVPPVLPLLILSSMMTSRPLALRLAVIGTLSPLIWWPTLQAQADVTTLVPAGQLPAAVVLGGAAGLLVALIHGDLRISPRTGAVKRVAAVGAVVAITLATNPDPASAHDPGQGPQVAEGRLRVERTGGSALLTMALVSPCDGVEAVRTVARRAGQTKTGTLTISSAPGSDCLVTGSVNDLGAGRWFVYAELKGLDDQRLEAWLPATDEATTAGIRPLYAPPLASVPASRTVAATALLLVVASLLIACLRLAHRTSQMAVHGAVPGGPTSDIRTG